MLIDQFIIEQLHVVAKPHAERIDNTSVFERSVLAGCLNAHIETQRNANCSCYLQGARATMQGIDAEIASGVTLHGMTIHCGDLVVHSDCVGRVVACAEEDGAFMVIIRRYELVRRMTHYSSHWRETPALTVWHAERVFQDQCFVECARFQCLPPLAVKNNWKSKSPHTAQPLDTYSPM